MFCTLVVILCYRKYIVIGSNNSYEFQSHNIVPYLSYDKIEKDKISELMLLNYTIEEKLNSVNKRIDDLYIFGGIIITLLLAINVGVYVKAESDVEKHFRDNYETYKTKILGLVEEAEQHAGKLKSIVDFNTMASKTLTDKPEPENYLNEDDNNGKSSA